MAWRGEELWIGEGWLEEGNAETCRWYGGLRLGVCEKVVERSRVVHAMRRVGGFEDSWILWWWGGVVG